MKRRDKNPLAVALGRLAGKKLTKRQRHDKARHAALARWTKVKSLSPTGIGGKRGT